MKRLSIIAGIILVLTYHQLSAQSTINLGIPETLFNAVTAATANSIAFAIPGVSVQCTWQTSFASAPASITLQLQTSLDNSTYAAADSSTSTAGEIRTFSTSAGFLRARINAVSGGSGITVIINCKSLNAGQILTTSNTWGGTQTFNNITITGTCTGCGGGGTPGGAVNSIQFNSVGSFGGFGSWDGNVFQFPQASLITPTTAITFGDVVGTAAAIRMTGSVADAGSIYIGYKAGPSSLSDFDTAGDNIFIGGQVGSSIDYTLSTGGSNSNVVIGASALIAGTFQRSTVAIGDGAGGYADQGGFNTFIGSSAAVGQSTGGPYGGTLNVFIGDETGKLVVNDKNTGIGGQSFFNITTGANNSGLGYRSCFNVTTGSGDVCLGYLSGPTGNQSNKLYIANTTTDTPLIGGDFSAPSVTLTGSITFGTIAPAASGTRFLCISTTGVVTSSSSACSGT